MEMEILLYIIILILLVTNNKKIKVLTESLKSLEDKIDSLKNHLYKKKAEEIFTTKTIKKEIVKEEKEIIQEEKKNIAAIAEEKIKPKAVFSNPIINPIPQEIDEKVIQKTSKKTIGKKIQNKITDFKKNNPDIEKFIGENLISKIGILILVLGISFFVKFAIDNEWINEVGRVGIGFLSGGILLAFAHKLQKNYKAFSSILVSGAITVFYFIITYAFKEYGLFSQTTAFILLVLITIFSVAISILYDRKELGVLSLIGAFAVPVLSSSGSGNFVVLFTYLLIVNAGFLILSIKKKWFVINVLTFVFTHLFFFSWLAKDTDLKDHASTLFLFASLFYFVFYLMNIFRVIKEREYAMKPMVMSLFLISTFVFFGQGLFLLDYFGVNFKGAFTLLLAIINLASGWLLLKNKIIDQKTVYLFIGMTLTFLTLAGPMQLQGNYITLFWAAESTLLIWLSQKINNNDFKIAAFITVVLMLFSLSMDFEQIYNSTEKLNVLFNKGFVTGIFSVLTLSLSAYLLHKEKTTYTIKNIEIKPEIVKIVFLVIAGIVLYITGILELSHQSKNYFDIYLARTIKIIYNFIFATITIIYTLKSSNKYLKNAGLIISSIALLRAILFIGSTPFLAFTSSLSKEVSNPTFYVQFVLFVMTLYIIKLVYSFIYKEKSNYKILPYLIATVFVTLVSLELLLISQPILVNPILEEMDTLYSVIQKSKIAVIKTSFPILWGLLSFVFLYFGIKNNKKEWRVFALVLVAVTIIKLFTYDIGNVSQGGKIIAFIILGIVLLVISFMYQRIKKLFNDEDNE